MTAPCPVLQKQKTITMVSWSLNHLPQGKMWGHLSVDCGPGVLADGGGGRVGLKEQLDGTWVSMVDQAIWLIVGGSRGRRRRLASFTTSLSSASVHFRSKARVHV